MTSGQNQERVGFEPTERYSRSAVFKTAAFNRSAISPYSFTARIYADFRQNPLEEALRQPTIRPRVQFSPGAHCALDRLIIYSVARIGSSALPNFHTH